MCREYFYVSRKATRKLLRWSSSRRNLLLITVHTSNPLWMNTYVKEECTLILLYRIYNTIYSLLRGNSQRISFSCVLDRIAKERILFHSAERNLRCRLRSFEKKKVHGSRFKISSGFSLPMKIPPSLSLSWAEKRK